MIDAVLRSAAPLALDAFGPPSNESLAAVARGTSPDVAPATGEGYAMEWDTSGGCPERRDGGGYSKVSGARYPPMQSGRKGCADWWFLLRRTTERGAHQW